MPPSLALLSPIKTFSRPSDAYAYALLSPFGRLHSVCVLSPYNPRSERSSRAAPSKSAYRVFRRSLRRGLREAESRFGRVGGLRQDGTDRAIWRILRSYDEGMEARKNSMLPCRG